MNGSQQGWEPAQLAQLRVGQYIRIDHRWFDHPFVRRMFRISSEKELQVLREKKPTRVFVRQEQTAGEAATVEVVDARNQRDALASAQARMREALQRAQLAYSALGYGDPNAASILDELVAELAALRSPDAPVSGTIARRTAR